MKRIETKDWSFYPSTQVLKYTDGTTLELPSRLSFCLECLIEARGDTVDYDTLLMSVWKTTHREASTISSVISELRKLIRCENVKYIKTVPKKGYRFIGEFTESEIESETSIVTNSVPLESSVANDSYADTSSHLKSKRSKMVGISAVLLVVSISTYWFASENFLIESNHYTPEFHEELSTKESLKHPKFSELEILTHDKGIVSEFAVLDSGEWVVYTSQQSEIDVKKLKAKNILDGREKTLAYSAEDVFVSPSFSNSGDKVVYIRSNLSGCEVRMVDFSPDGFVEGTDRFVSNCGLEGLWMTPIFSADDTLIYFAKSESLTDPLKLIRHDLTSGYESAVTAPSTKGRGDYSFSVSPNGEYIGIVRNAHWTNSLVLIYDTKTGLTSELATLSHILLTVAWLDDETLVYRNSNGRLVGQDINTKELISLTEDKLKGVNFPVVSGGRLYAERGRLFNTEIKSIDLNNMEITQEIHSSFRDYLPVISKDRITFISDRSGQPEIWQKIDNRIAKVAGLGEQFDLDDVLLSEERGTLILLDGENLFELDLSVDTMSTLLALEKPISNLSLHESSSALLITYEDKERWYIDKLDLNTLERQQLVRGFTGKIVGNTLYYKKFHEDGLYSYDLDTQETSLFYENFNILSSEIWEITNENLIFLQDKKIHKVNINNKLKTSSALVGDARKISCSESGSKCVFDIYRFGETNIVELK